MNGRSVLLLAEPGGTEDDAPNILERLAPADRLLVEQAGKVSRYAAGQTLFAQGAPHHGIFIIRSGLIRSFYVSDAGREITLAFWRAGHFVGGPQIFGGGQHMWTSVAVAPSECILLPGARLAQLSREIPELAHALIEGLVHKGRCYCALLQLLATKSMRRRLALLLQLLARPAPEHPEWSAVGGEFSHGELASMIGSTRQWVSLMLARFEREGWVERDAAGRPVRVRVGLPSRVA